MLLLARLATHHPTHHIPGRGEEGGVFGVEEGQGKKEWGERGRMWANCVIFWVKANCLWTRGNA